MLTHIDSARWLEVLIHCRVKPAVAVEWAPCFERWVQPNRFSQGPRELDDFVGQVLHETWMLTKLRENLNYSAQRLTQVWPRRFPTLQQAASCAWSPEKLAERVYGGRIELGNTQRGDGFRYMGRGVPMVTGRANYALLQQLTAEPLLDRPELLEKPDLALRCGVLWWERRVPDSAIDSLERVTRAVQGGQEGLEQRRELTVAAGQAIGQLTESTA